MKISYLYIYIFLLSLSNPFFAFNQINLADKDFIDNADQFSDENGVRIYDSKSQEDVIEAQYIPPEVLIEKNTIEINDQIKSSQEQSDNLGFSKVVKSQNKKNIGFSFSQMAKNSKKTKTISADNKRVGFSFSQMAKNAKKVPTVNRQLNP